MSSCISSRARLTPSAMRTAISRRRFSARARRRLATLAHAMRSTIAATPISQLATFASLPSLGPRSRSTGPTIACGLAIAKRRVLRVQRDLFQIALSIRVGEVGRRGGLGDARLAAREDLEPCHVVRAVPRVLVASAPRRAILGRDRNERHDRVEVEAVETFRRDADDRVLRRADVNQRAECLFAAAELAFANTRRRARRRAFPPAARPLRAVKKRPITGLMSNIFQRSVALTATRISVVDSPVPTAALFT